jgi:hypothetical protein
MGLSLVIDVDELTKHINAAVMVGSIMLRQALVGDIPIHSKDSRLLIERLVGGRRCRDKGKVE